MPKGETTVRAGDTLVLYTRAGVVEELEQRRRYAEGERAHAAGVASQAVERARGGEEDSS